MDRAGFRGQSCRADSGVPPGGLPANEKYSVSGKNASGNKQRVGQALEPPAPPPAPVAAAPEAPAPAPTDAAPAPAGDDMPPADPSVGDEAPSDDLPSGDSTNAEEPKRSDYMEEIQKFAGKLGQELRDQHERLESDDIKYVLNMIISAVDLKKLEEFDFQIQNLKNENEELKKELQGGRRSRKRMVCFFARFEKFC